MTHRPQTSGTSWHVNQVRWQRPLAFWTLQSWSSSGIHGAPAHRKSARRIILTTCHHRALYRCSSKHQPCGAASAVVEQQCSLPLMRPTLTHTATWQPRQQPLTGSAAPAQPRAAAEAKDPCSIEAVGEDFPKKRICKVVLLFSGVLGRASECLSGQQNAERKNSGTRIEHFATHLTYQPITRLI